MEKQRKIIWNSKALETISQALKWISAESIQGAEIVEKNINLKLNQASVNPYRFPPDKLKINNSGKYRCFVAHSYLVSYMVKETEILILRIRHIKQKPKGY